VAPEVVAGPLPFAIAIAAELPSGIVLCALLLTRLGPLLVVDPLFPLLGGGDADAAPSTLVERPQEHTRLGEEFNGPEKVQTDRLSSAAHMCGSQSVQCIA